MPDRFSLLERLGHGAMGTVWKARDRQTGQIVALKLMHPHLAAEPEVVARFEHEVEAMRRIPTQPTPALLVALVVVHHPHPQLHPALAALRSLPALARLRLLPVPIRVELGSGVGWQRAVG